MNSHLLFASEGFYFVEKFFNLDKIKTTLPEKMYTEGHEEWDYNGNLVESFSKELQVPGSYSRTFFPVFKNLHESKKYLLEDIIGFKLVPTYYFDRTYYSNTTLIPHIDNISCEISVTIQLNTTLSSPWKFFLESRKNNTMCFDMNNGDGLIYMGNSLKHWRYPMPGGKKDFHHQLFLHYVIENGECHNKLLRQGYFAAI